MLVTKIECHDFIKVCMSMMVTQSTIKIMQIELNNKITDEQGLLSVLLLANVIVGD
jgi:hypothetical protein